MLEIKVLQLQLERPLSSKSIVFISHLSSLSNITAEELNSRQTIHHSHSHWAELLLIYVRAKRLSETVRVECWDMQVGDCSWPPSETVYHHHYQYQQTPGLCVHLAWHTAALWIATAQERMDWFCLNHMVNYPAVSPKSYSTREGRATLSLLIWSYSVLKHMELQRLEEWVRSATLAERFIFDCVKRWWSKTELKLNWNSKNWRSQSIFSHP